MGAKHGLGSALSGCRIFNRDTLCSRTGLMVVGAPRGGIVGEALEEQEMP
jgi:hypothetical protein